MDPCLDILDESARSSYGWSTSDERKEEDTKTRQELHFCDDEYRLLPAFSIAGMLCLGRFSRTLISASLFATSCNTSFGWTASRRIFAPSVFRTRFQTAGFYLLSGSATLFSSSSADDKTMTSTTAPTCSLTVAQIPCLSDNYGYLIHDEATGQTAAIDTPEAGPYKRELEKRGWTLTHIFNTHHHWDHTGANAELKSLGNVKIFGPASEKIPGIDEKLTGGDEIEFGSTKAKIIDVGGHTKGHIAYYFEEDAKVFVGDSLFALGCGKMFEGNPEQFWASLKRLRALPDETEVFCAHEYTASNAKFAASVEPGNVDLMARVQQIREKRNRGEPTVPSLLSEEKKTNPFLRCDFSDEIRKNVGVVDGDNDAAAFGKTRLAKDRF